VPGTPSDERWPFVNLDYPEALAWLDVVVTVDRVCACARESGYPALKVLSVHVCSSELLLDPATY